ncbi:hypothetical protein SMICM304S_07271 [Streptomyces microflavus]
MERQGYALRVQCRSVGASRVVEVGAQFPEMPVEWTSLSECTLTPDGILTPGPIRMPDGIVPRQAVTSEPRLAIPSTSFLITEATPTRNTVTHRWFDTTLRVTARLSLPARAASPEGQHTYRPTSASLSIDGDGTWVVQAQSLEQAQATVHACPRASTSSPAAPPSPSAERQALPPEANLVASFRATMENAASNGKGVTTTGLCREAALRDCVLSAEQWVRLLLAVEQPRTPGKPVLCALIKGRDGGPAPFFREALHGIGWTRDFSRAICSTFGFVSARRVLAAYGSDAWLCWPPCLPLRPSSRSRPPPVPRPPRSRVTPPSTHCLTLPMRHSGALTSIPSSQLVACGKKRHRLMLTKS